MKKQILRMQTCKKMPKDNNNSKRNRKTMKTINVLLATAIAAVAVTLSGCGKSGGGRPDFGDNEYPVLTVGVETAQTQTTYPATIKGVQDVEIRPKVSGFITRLAVQEGQSVAKGQLLFTVDNASYVAAVRQSEAAVNQAQASVNSAQAQLATATLTYKNSQELYKNNVIGSFELQSAKNTMETAQAAVAQAKSAVAQAQAALANARESLSWCYVTSPTSGVVGNLPYKQGALVSPSSTPAITTISNISSMEVYFSMTEKDILSMTKNAGGINAAVSDYPPVRLRLADGTMYGHTGTVTKVSGVIDPSTGSVSMIARFDNPERVLKSGGSGEIVVARTNASAIVIPQTACTTVQDKIFVYKVGKDNKVVYSEITVNPQNDGKNYIVTGGLKAGERIVSNGITKLTDKMEIKPISQERYQQKIREQAKSMTAGDIVGGMKK